MLNKPPLVSVITAVLNSEKYLEKSIKSVISQNYENIEYVIIDGGSNDGTLDIISKYKGKISFFVSEKDKGISDAFNKGIKNSKGKYVVFLGASDYFLSSDVISKMIEGVNPEKDMIICGGIERISEDGNSVLYINSPSTFNKRTLLFKMPFPHQGIFMNRKYFEKYGLFDEKCKYSMDYELLLRAYGDFPKFIIRNILVAAWRTGGIGSGKIIEIYKEQLFCKIKNKVSLPLLLWIIFIYQVFKYYFGKIFIFRGKY